MSGSSEGLGRLDDALMRLRRITAAPPPGFVVESGVGAPPATASTVLVVDVCARADGEVSVGLVARALGVEHSTASRLVDRAVRGGFVVRSSSTADARRAALALTRAGRSLHERASAFRRDRLAEVVAGGPAAGVAKPAPVLDPLAAGASDRGRVAV